MRNSEAIISALALTTGCSMFGISEVISLIADGKEVEDIILGIYQSVSGRVLGLLDRVGVKEEIAMSGGVAKNRGVVGTIEDKLGLPVFIPEEPQIVGALGAALIAIDRMKAGK